MPLDASLGDFLERHGLQRSGKLDLLRGATIAIDAHNWMKVLTPKINEPYQAVMGGVPLTMHKAVTQELARFKAAEITPIFVFNGLPMVLTQPPRGLLRNPFLMDVYEKREQAWQSQHEGKSGCRTLFDSAGSTITSSEFQHNLIRILREHSAEFFKAPYMSWAQMAYWCSQSDRSVHQIHGPSEVLMFENVDVLVLDIHFEPASGQAPEFDYVIKSEIKRKLAATSDEAKASTLSDSQFLDCCLLTGLKGQVKHMKIMTLDFPKAAQGVLKFGNAYDFIAAKEASAQLLQSHMRIRAVIRHAVVFTLEGECHPISQVVPAEDKEPVRVPCNLSDLWGSRLPNLLYFFLSIGALQTQVLINVVQNQMIETIPQMDTEEYRALLNRILPLRSQIAHQLIHQLGERDEKFLHRSPMECWRWFATLPVPIPRPPQIKLDEWAVTDRDILRKQKEGGLKLGFIFVVTNYAQKATQAPRRYGTFNEVLCVMHLKALDLLGYFTHAAQPANESEPPSGMSRFSEALCATQEPEFSEEAVLLIELFRTKALTARHYRFANPDVMERGAGSEDPWACGKRDSVHYPPLRLPPVYMDSASADCQEAYDHCCLLTSRVWSLLSMTLTDSPWYAEVSKDLLAFNTIVRALHKTLRNLIEVVAAVLFLESHAAIDPYHYSELPQKLPFGQESNTAMGIVIDFIMRNDHWFGKPGKEMATRAARVEFLKTRFPCCKDLEGDLRRGFRFWKAAYRVFTVLREEPNVVLEELQRAFPLADQMLRIKLHQIIDLGSDADPEGPFVGAALPK